MKDRHPELRPCELGQVVGTFRHLWKTEMNTATLLRIISAVDRAFAAEVGLPPPAEVTARTAQNHKLLLPRMFADAYYFAALRETVKEKGGDALRYYNERYQYEKKCAAATWRALNMEEGSEEDGDEGADEVGELLL